MKAQWKRITAQIADFKPDDRVTVPVGPLLWARGEIERLQREVERLRHYGNKDYTAMTDREMQHNTLEQS